MNCQSFFRQKEGKINVKESHLLAKNKLLQQQISNGENAENETELKVYGRIHRQVFILEEERLFYLDLYNRLTKGKPHG
jgi:hypothetical protein